MKLNKGKNKGKVHPSPSSSSSSSSSVTQNDPVSSLNSLLPAAILTLISILSLQDKEVLAYMIAHSLYSTSPFFTPLNVTASPTRNKKVTPNNKKKVTVGSTSINNGKKAAVTTTTTTAHKIPSFDCRCFECYTSYWFRWDSSPHQDLIHEAIESFEEHLTASEQQKKKTKKVATPNNKSSRRRENHNKVKKSDVATTSPISTPTPAVIVVDDVAPAVVVEKVEEDSPEILEVGSPENGESPTVMGSPVKGDDVEERENEVQEKKHVQQQQQHKGLARKVLPDVIGLINSRLWNLWGPNV